MRSIEEVKQDSRVQVVKPFSLPRSYIGLVQLTVGKRRTFQFIASVDKDEQGTIMEHVSVSLTGSTHKLPSWEEMCEVKEIFWYDDKEVHQIHPKEAEYIHGVSYLSNVLHLWRPEGGWTY